MKFLGRLSFFLFLFCLLTTMGLKLAIPGWIPYFNIGFGFGLFFLLLSCLLNLKTLKNLFHSESLRFLGQSFLTLIFIFCILVVFNYILFKQTEKKDITANKIHSFTKLTQSLVRAIPKDIQFVYFYADSKQVHLFKKKVKDEVKRYQDLSSRVSYEAHSVFERPDLVKEFKVGGEESALYIRYEGRIERISNLKESSITNALLKLTKESKKIYFVEAGDARKVGDSSAFGLSGFKEQVERLHYQVDSLQSLNSLPEDIAILVLPGLREPLTDVQLDQVKLYLERGGSVLLMIDPGENHGFSSFLNLYGISDSSYFMFTDQVQPGQSSLLVPTHRGRALHEISQQLIEGQNPYFFVSSALEMAAEVPDNLRVIPILNHLPTSVARKEITESSEAVQGEGEWHAALISEGVKSSFFRLVVVADSDFLTNEFYDKAGNFDFSMSLFNYLSKDEDLLKMKVPQAQTTYLVLTQTQMKLYFLFFVLPFAALFFIMALFFRLQRFF